MSLKSLITGSLLSSLAALLTACEPGVGPFQSNPWAGFPPSFATAPYSQYRTQYDTDRAAYKADPAAFMRRHDAGIDCGISPERQKQFAVDAFSNRPEHSTPSWQEVLSTYADNLPPPIVDQVAIRVLEGNCADGSVNGPATIHATFLRVTKLLNTETYYATKVELLETCTYMDLRRTGDCRRYHALRADAATVNAEGKLFQLEHVDPIISFIAEYGVYADGAEATPGVAFELTANPGDLETNMTLARYPASNDRLKYEEYIGGEPAAMTFFRRIADRALHGPVVAKGGFVVSCYEAGVRVIRAAGCMVE